MRCDVGFYCSWLSRSSSARGPQRRSRSGSQLRPMRSRALLASAAGQVEELESRIDQSRVITQDEFDAAWSRQFERMLAWRDALLRMREPPDDAAQARRDARTVARWNVQQGWTTKKPRVTWAQLRKVIEHLEAAINKT